MDWKRAGTVKFEAYFSSFIDLNLNMMKSKCNVSPIQLQELKSQDARTISVM